MHTLSAVILAAGLALPSAALAASTIEFNLLESSWSDPVGGNLLAIDGTPGNPSTIYWGQNGLTPGINASGYTYTNRPTSFTESPDDVFGIGIFAHDNFPISAGTAIDQATLNIRAGVKVVDGAAQIFDGILDFAFDVFHDETPNAANPCAYADDGSDPQGPVNRNGCADRVSIVGQGGNPSFSTADGKYTLAILGFSETLADADAGIFSPIFLSAEGVSNARVLAAEFTAPIPVPGSLLLMGSAIAGFAAYGTRKRRKAA